MVESEFEPSHMNSMFFACHVLLHLIQITFNTMTFPVQNLEERIEEASLRKVSADLFSGWKIPLLHTSPGNGHGSKTPLLSHSKPPKAGTYRIKLWMSSIF